MAEAVEKKKKVTTESYNAAVRLFNLPLVNSTYDKVSSAYANTKDNHPRLKSVCNIAEKSVKNMTSVAMTSAKPMLQKFEPQITMANNIACVGLDKIEEKLPQPSDKVRANASESVVGAKDAVLNSITGVVGKTKRKVQNRAEAVVYGSVNTVLGSTKEPTKTEDFALPKDKSSSYVRPGFLSSKTGKRAHQQAGNRIKDLKSWSQKTISQVQNIVDQVPKDNINDLASKTDGNLDILEEEELQGVSQANDRVINLK
ncbi:Belongs to the perilipin family [Pristimantis euphronides]